MSLFGFEEVLDGDGHERRHAGHSDSGHGGQQGHGDDDPFDLEGPAEDLLEDLTGLDL
jgi:hypothetical protein